MHVKGLLLLAQCVAFCAAYGHYGLLPRGGEIIQSGRNFTNATTSSSSSTTTTTTTTTLTTTTSKELSSTTTSTTTHLTTLTPTSSNNETSTTEHSSTAADTTTTSSGFPLASFLLAKLNSSMPLPTGSLVPSSPANRTAAAALIINPTPPSRLNSTSASNSTTAAPTALTTGSSSGGSSASSLFNSTSTTTNTTTTTKCGIAGSYVTPPTHATRAKSINDCKAACAAQAASSCRAFEVGTVDGNGNNCWLFAHSLSDMAVGPARDGFSWTFFDRGCDVDAGSHCRLRGSFVTPPFRMLRVVTLAGCQAACRASSRCLTFEAGSVDGSGNNCWLFDVPVNSLNIGGATDGWDWAFFDKDCDVSSS